MPARGSIAAPASRASSPLSKVPLQLPGAGCTTRPAGLSTTSRCSSSCTTCRSIGFGPERLALRGGPQFDRERCAGAHAVRGPGRGAAVDGHRAIGHQLLQVTARELGHQVGQGAVQALAMQRLRHGHGAQLGRRARLGLVVRGVLRGGRRGGRSYNRPALFQEGLRVMLRAKLSCLAAAAVLLGACSSTPVERGPNLSPNRLYADAKEEMGAGSWDKAVPILERLEGRAAGTPLAQQAQLDKAYSQYKSGEPAQARLDARPLHEAAPGQPGDRLRAVPQGPGELQRQPGPAGLGGAPGPVRA